MAITAATIDQRYSASGALLNAHRALEEYAIVSNPNRSAAVDAATSAAVHALGAASTGSGGTGATSVVLTSGVAITAPVTGAGTASITATIVNGVVTGFVRN